MGLDCRMIVALLTSVAAKRIGSPLGCTVSGVRPQHWPPRSHRQQPFLLVIQMTFIPCVATVAAIVRKRAPGGGQYSAWCLLLGISCIAGVVVYQVGRLLKCACQRYLSTAFESGRDQVGGRCPHARMGSLLYSGQSA